MKVVIELLREVIANRYWCNRCDKHVDYEETGYGGYSNTPRYHKECGEDVFDSDFRGKHEEMLKQALDLLESAVEEEHD